MSTSQCIRHRLFAVAIAVAATFSPQPARADFAYVTGSGNEFGTINLSTGVFTQIGTLNLLPTDNIFGMGFGSDGNLYGLDSSPSANLFRIDITNANVTNLGSVGPSAIGAGTDASGKMYALSQDNNALFYTLNPPSAITNVVGLTGLPDGSGGLVAPNAAGTQLFASAFNAANLGGPYDLDSINLSTGVATLVGNTGFSPGAGVFVNGTLYGFDLNNEAIITIDTTTGAGTQVATYSLPNGDFVDAAAAAPAATPEPASVTLCVIGGAIASAGFLRRRRG